MRYFKITASNGYCGCDEIQYLELPNTITEKELDEIAMEIANENAQSYEYCHTGWDTSHKSDEEIEEELSDYYENYVCGDYVEISKEEYEENV